jgi:Ca-activated chloride channel family protein
MATGRRPSVIHKIDSTFAGVHPHEWGILSKIFIPEIVPPKQELRNRLLRLYQTEFKKPSLTVYCLDMSKSQKGELKNTLDSSMTILFDQEIADRYLLNAGKKDINIVIPFDEKIIGRWTIEGNNQDQFKDILDQLRSIEPRGTTNLYGALIAAYEEISKFEHENYLKSIVLMTDGESNIGATYDDLVKTYKQYEIDSPIIAIPIGKASKDQLHQLTELTRGRIVDASDNLVNAFREAKGYN